MKLNKYFDIKHKKINYLPLIILPIILLVSFAVWLSKVDPIPTVNVDFDNGFYDMRDIDFSSTYGGIRKDVEYVLDALLTPEEFDQRDDILVGRVPDGERIYTARIKVLVPDGKYYGIVGYSMNYASKVYINGNWVFDEGKTALTIDEERSSESYYLFSVVPENGVIEIVVQTSAFSNVDNSSGMGWSFGDYQMIRVSHTRYITSHIIVMSWYLIASIISLLLFLVLPRYKANVWLALLGIVWSIRTGLKGVKILLTLFPVFEWPVIYKLEILTSPLTIILFVLILHSSFPKALPKWLRWGLISAASAFVIGIFIIPWYKFFGHSSYTNMLIYLVLAIMFPFILFSLRKNKVTLPQIIMLIGVALSIFAFAWDADYFSHGWAPISISQPMMLSFVLLMTASALLATVEETTAQEVYLAQKLENQERELIDARISIMLSQIRPHFLYNTLTSIAMLCKKDSLKAEEAILDFSRYLRVNMDSLTETKMISFEKELNHVEVYLKLEKMRYQEDLTVIYNIKVNSFLLPAITVQPIVENAVRYGVGKKEDGGTITISTEENNNEYLIIISDDGAGFDQNMLLTDERSHIGINSVKQRLLTQCGGSLSIKSEIDVGTTVTISIPKNGGI